MKNAISHGTSPSFGDNALLVEAGMGFPQGVMHAWPIVAFPSILGRGEMYAKPGGFVENEPFEPEGDSFEDADQGSASFEYVDTDEEVGVLP